MEPAKILRVEAVAADLRDWSSQHDLVEQALASARVSLRNSELENTAIGLKPVLDYRQILLQFDKQSLVFQSGLSYVYIDTQIGLYLRDDSGGYFRGLKSVGYYRLITMPDGRVEEDYLVFDEPYQAQAEDAA